MVGGRQYVFNQLLQWNTNLLHPSFTKEIAFPSSLKLSTTAKIGVNGSFRISPTRCPTANPHSFVAFPPSSTSLSIEEMRFPTGFSIDPIKEIPFATPEKTGDRKEKLSASPLKNPSKKCFIGFQNL